MSKSSQEKAIDYSREGFDKNHEELDAKCKELLGKDYRAFSLLTIEHEFNQLLGDILTIIDAGYGEMPKTKYCKDLLKRAVWHKIAEVHTIYFSDCPWNVHDTSEPPQG